MYNKISPLQRIDEPNTARQSRLYEPLRRSLLRNNLSQSNISSRSNLSNSRVNDLSTSRVSRRMKSLSPQEIEQIISQKSNTFIPITKRLVPTNNLQMVRYKKFQAIDVKERIHKPIPAIRFNSINRFNVNKVEEIVYQTEDQANLANQAHYQRSYQPSSLQYSFGPGIDQNPRQSQFNIYTNRNQRTINQVRRVSQVKEYLPRESYQMGSATKPVFETFGYRNSQQAPFQQNMASYETHYVNSIPANNPPLTATGSFQPTSNNVTSFERTPGFNPSTLPILTSIGLQNDTPQSPNLYTSQCNGQLRQLPTQHTLSFLSGPFGSRTSFEPQTQKPQSSASKSYDFSKLTQDSQISDYKQKKQEEWKYNLFSVFDEPVNTKCSKTGCFNNEIIASRPNLYEWQQ